MFLQFEGSGTRTTPTSFKTTRNLETQGASTRCAHRIIQAQRTTYVSKKQAVYGGAQISVKCSMLLVRSQAHNFAFGGELASMYTPSRTVVTAIIP